VDVANNGQEALDQLASNTYDGVLLDIQMPVMDGYTAAREIRKQDQLKDLPVIAMTANAMVGDREKALEAGMNDHIAKPLNVAEMFATMAKWITPSIPSSVPSASAGGTGALAPIPGIDIERGLVICAGNADLYRKLLVKFAKAYGEFEREFHEAQSSDEEDAAMRAAHTLKGVAGNIAAREVAITAEALESACRTNAAAEAISARLKELMGSLAPVLKAIAAADLKPGPAPTETSAELVDIAACIDQLRELLGNADTKSRDTAEKLLAAIQATGDRDLIESLIAHIDIYDFDAAMLALKEIEHVLLKDDFSA
jgi:CheY-like chemotaxis protein